MLDGNAVLAGLKGDERAAALSAGELVDLKIREALYRPEEKIREAYFPLGAVISVVARMKDGAMIEVGTIGREGTSAIPLLLGSETSANESFCQVPGKAFKMDADAFRRLLSESQRFRDLLNRHLQAYVNMLGQMAACNRLHNVHQRCARWLLMTQDRVGEDRFPLTHEFLAMMLGSRRAGVTVAAELLQKAGLIQYAHGWITVLDRAGLEAAACECYGVTVQQFGNLLKPHPHAKTAESGSSPTG